MLLCGELTKEMWMEYSHMFDFVTKGVKPISQINLLYYYIIYIINPSTHAPAY